LTTNLVPKDLRVTELRRIDGEDWARALGEGDTVRRVSDVLVLCCSGIEGVDGDKAALRVNIDVEEPVVLFRSRTVLPLKMPLPGLSGAMAIGRFFQV
jgi:hypothetical protein